MAPGADGQIWPRACGPHIGHERAKPHFLVAVMRHRPNDSRMGVERIEIGRFAHAELETSVIHGAVDGRPTLRPIALDDDRPIAAVDRVTAEIDVVFDGNEQRQQVRPSPAFIPPRGQRSKSNGAPRAAMVALTIDVPPTRRPRGTRRLRPPNVPAPSVLVKSQSNSGIPPAPRQWCSPLKVKSGGTVSSCGKSGPASRSKTLREAFSVRRAATT